MLNIRVLVTDGDQKHSLGIVRALGKNGFNVGVITAKKNSLCSFSKYCVSEHLVVAHQDSDYINRLINVYKEFSYDVLLPVGSFANFVCIQFRHLLEKNFVRVTLPPSDSFHTAFSKELTATKAKQLGIDSPRTWYFSSFDELESFQYNFTNKIVIKARLEMGANVVKYVTTKPELVRVFKDLCNEYNWSKASEFPLVQEFIDGPGRGFFALFKDGSPVRVFQHIRLREYPVTGGMSVAAKFDYSDYIEEKGLQLLRSLNWNGIAMVEFKEDKSGKLYLLEINPKFWGSIELAIFCGVNFPVDYILLTLEKKLEPKNAIISHNKFHWPLHGDLQTSFHSIERFKAFIKDLLDPHVGSNVNFKDDIIGTVGIIINLTQKALKLR
jgi:predicted ATP-grasp superfamily ATP-dependent carboligase